MTAAAVEVPPARVTARYAATTEAFVMVDDPEAETPVAFEPEPGDQIAMVQGATRFVFEVMPLDGTRESEWLDTTTDQYRIHSRLVKRQPTGDAWP